MSSSWETDDFRIHCPSIPVGFCTARWPGSRTTICRLWKLHCNQVGQVPRDGHLNASEPLPGAQKGGDKKEARRTFILMEVHWMVGREAFLFSKVREVVWKTPMILTSALSASKAMKTRSSTKCKNVLLGFRCLAPGQATLVPASTGSQALCRFLSLQLCVGTGTGETQSKKWSLSTTAIFILTEVLSMHSFGKQAIPLPFFYRLLCWYHGSRWTMLAGSGVKMWQRDRFG